MNMNIAPGTIAAPTSNSTGTVLCYSDAVEVVTSPTAPGSGTNRYDVVVCQPRGNDLDGGTNNDFVFQVVSGTASASPTVPATPAGAVAIAQILVIGASAALAAGNLTDRRPFGLSPPGGELGYGANTAPAGFSPTTTETDVPGCAVTVNLAATRKLKVSGRYFGTVATTASLVTLRLRYGGTSGATGTQIQQSNWGPFNPGNWVDAAVAVRVSLAAGTYTFRLTASTGTAGAFWPLTSDPTYPVFVLVEDLGAP
jgi:hypothetical protein